MKILVTGGSGFIGGYLVKDLLRDGHEVTIYDRAPSATFPALVSLGDMRNREQLFNVIRGQDVVFHLAAEHRDDVRPASLYEEVNVQGAGNLVEAAKQAGCKRLIFTSSVAVYPLNARCPSEKFPPAPFNAYGRSKLAAEEVFQTWALQDPRVSLTVVRPCVVFGEGNRGNVYNLVQQVDAGTFVMVGDGQNRKSLAYVENLISFLVSTLSMRPGFHLFNYADKPDLTTNEIIRIARETLGVGGRLAAVRLPYAAGLVAGYCCDLLAALLRRKLPVSSIRVRKFCAETSVDASKLETTGFQRQFSLEDGLRRTIAAEFKAAKRIHKIERSLGAAKTY